MMILNFIGGKTSEIKVTKDGRKYMYFTATGNNIKYRMNKETKEIQVSPYWNKIKGMYISEQ